MLYQPGSSIAIAQENFKENLILYSNPTEYSASLNSTYELFRTPNLQVTITVSDKPYGEVHAKSILDRYNKNIKDIIFNTDPEFKVEYELLIDYVLNYISQIRSNQSIRICIDQLSFAFEIDYNYLVKRLGLQVFRAGFSLINGYLFNISLENDGSILVHRCSVNGFYPENTFHQENESMFTISSIQDIEDHEDEIVNYLSSLLVGECNYVLYDQVIPDDLRAKSIKRISSKLFGLGYKIANGFNYEYRWHDSNLYKITRLTLDNQRSPVEEP